MSISAHRPGRFDSQGRILLDPHTRDAAEAETEELSVDREFVPDATGSQAPDDAPTAVFGGPDHSTAVLDDAQQTAVLDDARPTSVLDDPAPTAAIPDARPASLVDGEDDLVFATPIRRRPVEEPVIEEPVVAEPAAQPPVAETVEFPVYTPPRERVPMSRRLAVLGGAESSVLDRVPTETPRFVQMFFVLLGTAVVSALSMFFALITGVQLVVWIAIPLAIVWALIIFNLDRFLTSTMKSSTSMWKLIGLALPRVVMAAIIGVVVAEPLVLQVFHNDISREVTSTNITQSLTDQDALETGPEKKALDSATANLQALETQAATGIVAGAEGATATVTAAQATVDSLTAQLADQQKVIDQARAIYQCELTGEGADSVQGCTGLAGEGASSDSAQAQLEGAQGAYDALATKLKDAQSELAAAQTAAGAQTAAAEETNRSSANDQLPAAQKTYDAALAAYNARAEQVAGTNAGAVGLLSQITALNSLGEKEPALKWAHWLIAALFFMIELLPVLVKVLTSHGEKSLYEKAADIGAQVDLDRATAEGFRQRAAIATGA